MLGPGSLQVQMSYISPSLHGRLPAHPSPAASAKQVADPEVWSWQDIQALDIEAVADNPCFLFLWCGAEEGLEAGRVCMQVGGRGRGGWVAVGLRIDG